MRDVAPDHPPIACTLGVGDLKARVAWIADLNVGALRSHRRDDLRLHLTYAPSAGDAVREMIAKEQACCAFLDFATQQDGDGLQLTITAPEEAREAAELVFEHFVAKSPKATVSLCGCGNGADT